MYLLLLVNGLIMELMIKYLNSKIHSYPQVEFLVVFSSFLFNQQLKLLIILKYSFLSWSFSNKFDLSNFLLYLIPVYQLLHNNLPYYYLISFVYYLKNKMLLINLSVFNNYYLINAILLMGKEVLYYYFIIDQRKYLCDYHFNLN